MDRRRRGNEALRVVSWNLDGFRPRRNELIELLYRLDVDVVALQETKTKATHITRIPGYHVYRRDREGRPGGGVAIAVRRGVDHHLLGEPQLEHAEAVAVAVRTPQCGNVAVVSCFLIPNQPMRDHDLDAILEMSPRTVAIGDLNAKSPVWNSRTVNTRGRQLLRYLEGHDEVLVVGPEEPTYDGLRGLPDVLDVAILKAIPAEIHLEVHHEGSTAHNPILLEIGGRRQPCEDTDFVKRTTDWELFRATMTRYGGPIPVIETEEDLEAAIASLETDINTALAASTTETVTRRVANPRGELPPELKQMIAERRNARRRAQRTRLPEDRRIANQASRRTRAALDELAQERWRLYLESLNPQDNSLWKARKVMGNRRRAMPPIHGVNGVVYTKQEKAEAMVDGLELQCRENNMPDEDEEHTLQAERAVRRTTRAPDRDQIRPATPEEVKEILSRLQPRKAPGYDGITNRTLRKLPRKSVVALTNITNAVLRQRYFPKRWKKADVIMIPKPGKDLKFPSNYRPISLLPAMSKVVERIILARMKECSEELGTIPDEQFAYRSGHSTELQVLRLVEHVTEGFNRRQVTGAVFLDVSKAFDRVWHHGLLFKMIQLGYPASMVKLTKSYLEGRRVRVKVDEALSTYRRTEAGVPQGTVLSPHLFSIYTSDLPKTERTSTCLYADDTAIMARSTQAWMATRNLQTATDLLERWCNRWKVAINPDKSSGMFFSRRHTQRPAENITFAGDPIPWVQTTRYLGVTLDRGLTWQRHVQEVVNRAKAERAILYPLLSRDSELNRKNKLTLIKTVIRPKLTYASAAWAYAAETHMKKIAAVEATAIRQAIGARGSFGTGTSLETWSSPPSARSSGTERGRFLRSPKCTAIRWCDKRRTTSPNRRPDTRSSAGPVKWKKGSKNRIIGEAGVGVKVKSGRLGRR